LAYTGENVERLLGIALGSILLGGLLLLAVGRRRRFGDTKANAVVLAFVPAERSVWAQWRKPGSPDLGR
jgi:hypothetical protein